MLEGLGSSGRVIEVKKGPSQGELEKYQLGVQRQVVEELLSGKSGAAKLCRKYNIYSSLFYYLKDIYCRRRFDDELAQEGALGTGLVKLDRLVFPNK